MPDTFTPEQISQILEEFFKVVGTRQYIGARYVPIFGRKDEESIEWDNTGEYEPLTIVLYQGNSYTSRQFVPVGVEITNQEFWAITGNYNAQVEMYRRETAAAREVADDALAAAGAAQDDIDTLLPKADFDAENTVKKYVDDSAAAVRALAMAAQADVDTLLPKADFSAENTVKKYIDLNKTRVLSFDTVADMQTATDLVAGMTCHTNGFHSAGDGGAAYYTVSTSGTANGMDVLALQNNLYAKLKVTEPYVTPEMLGARSDGIADDTLIIQRCLDVSSHVRLNGDYLVSKNTAFGDSASCVNIVNDDVTIDGVGTLHVATHAQSIIGIDGANNVTIQGIKVEGYGQFPSLEGATGRGEKGTDSAGYNTSGFWYYYFNNSFDTSERTDHSPSGTGVAWGTFGDGYIGNVGSGILVTGESSNISIQNVEASGFNGAGITVGHYGDTALRSDISIHDCNIHDCYSAGIDMYNYDGLVIDGCYIRNIGHPSAQPSDIYQDPGYGVACSIGDSSKNTFITNNNISDCVRKGIDAHGADRIQVIGNIVNNAWTYGLDIEGNGLTSFVRNVSVISNTFRNCSYSSGAGGAIKCGMTAVSEITDCNIIISDNQIIDCGYQDSYGFIVSMLFNNLAISNNLISGYHERISTNSLGAAIYVGSSRGESGQAIVSGNIIDISRFTTTADVFTVSIIKCNATCFGNIISGADNQLAFGAGSGSNQKKYINSFGNSYDSARSGSSVGAGSAFLQIPTGNGNPTKNGALSGTGNELRYQAPNGMLYKLDMTQA